MPPVAARLAEYDAPTVPSASVLVVTLIAVATILSTAEDEADCSGEDESMTRRVSENVPVAVGIPDSTPAELKVTPLGRTPAAIDQL